MEEISPANTGINRVFAINDIHRHAYKHSMGAKDSNCLDVGLAHPTVKNENAYGSVVTLLHKPSFLQRSPFFDISPPTIHP
jgi:hypothetical protein